MATTIVTCERGHAVAPKPPRPDGTFQPLICWKCLVTNPDYGKVRP